MHTFLLRDAILVGAGATLAMDLWAIFNKRVFGIASLDYALVGRWLGHLPRGRFAHDAIGQAAPVRGERAWGWLFHYLTGIAFAAILLALAGPAWLQHPTLAPALLLGIATIVAPFFILQPGLGAGIAASRTPRPNTARLRSLLTHTVFGAGLYASGWAVKLVSGL
ncbi:MAG TPA: DUF2938 domain-containing protein [Bordetella sp.]|nr:DUF2938 domain-containing protein [Bordetella sp.]